METMESFVRKHWQINSSARLYLFFTRVDMYQARVKYAIEVSMSFTAVSASARQYRFDNGQQVLPPENRQGLFSKFPARRMGAKWFRALQERWYLAEYIRRTEAGLCTYVFCLVFRTSRLVLTEHYSGTTMQ